ncbi:RNA polymerase sigma factor [Actinoplanes sp. NPDC049118]|uniref:RNA polymerase sigma factor n=1 Tax=Actinoplanes sp. NPDC049118 TaxID=3155769 RepID=UPI0033CC4C56
MAAVTQAAADTHADSDAAVIRASLADPDRFAAIYDRYAAMLYRYAYQRVGPEIADDVVAETFLAAFRGRASYDLDRQDARPWLFGILTRELATHHRRERARYRAMARTTHDTVQDGPADQVTARVVADAARGPLAAALADLAPGDRDVLLLVAWGQLSYDEVADSLNIPAGTVGSRLSRARRKVRLALRGFDPTMNTEESHEV